jgi:hypothetical protein
VILSAHLVPIWKPGLEKFTDRYNVVFVGQTIVERSRDPETDLARAMLERGYTGKVTLIDGRTGKPRTIIDIAKAARVRTVETGTYPRFRPLETCAERPHTAEAHMADSRTPKESHLVVVASSVDAL